MKIEIFSILLRTGIFCVYVCAANTHIHYISIRLEERRIVELRSKLPTGRLLQVMPTGKGRELTQTQSSSNELQKEVAVPVQCHVLLACRK